MAAWPYEFDESKRTKIKSGCCVFISLVDILTTWLPGRANVFDSADAIKENLDKSLLNLEEGDYEDVCQVVYLASAENKSLIGNIEMLNYGIGCALENDWRHAEKLSIFCATVTSETLPCSRKK